MIRYVVILKATASVAIEVEAESEEEAEELAWDSVQLPYFPGGMSGDLGEWETDDVSEVDE